jgi:hypothetical protein
MRVHGISFNVVWEKFGVGTSFFIPCLDPKEAETQVRATTKRLGYTVKCRTVIEENIKGLRVWRIK